jgi:hypothetical protein
MLYAAIVTQYFTFARGAFPQKEASLFDQRPTIRRIRLHKEERGAAHQTAPL